jgi:hypothetical protein
LFYYCFKQSLEKQEIKTVMVVWHLFSNVIKICLIVLQLPNVLPMLMCFLLCFHNKSIQYHDGATIIFSDWIFDIQDLYENCNYPCISSSKRIILFFIQLWSFEILHFRFVSFFLLLFLILLPSPITSWALLLSQSPLRQFLFRQLLLCFTVKLQ